MNERTYFMRSVEGGPVKIGFSTNVRKRKRALETARHDELRILTTIRGNIESQLHDRFSEYRIWRRKVRTEWFRFEGELRRYLVDELQCHYVPRPSREELIQALKSA